MKKGESNEGTEFETTWRHRFHRYALVRNDDAGIAGWTPTGLEARFRFFVQNWRSAPVEELWLDVGCGAGTYTRWLAANGHIVTGIDYSLPSLQKARARCSEAISWVVADAQALPVGSEKADGVLCFGVTQALAGSEKVISELARVTAKGGTLWIDGLNAWCLPHLVEQLRRRLTNTPMHIRYETPRGLRRRVQQSGFAEARLVWLPILPARLQWFQTLVESEIVSYILHWIPPLGAIFSHSMVIIARRASA